jgi:hypothetical protein
MIELEEFFIGKGETLGFKFTQLFKSNKAYMYEIFALILMRGTMRFLREKNRELMFIRYKGRLFSHFPQR